MPDFKQTFQEEVRRLARKELKAFEAKINEQKKTINALQKRVNDLEKKAAQVSVAPAADKKQDAPAPDGKERKARFSPKSISKFRKKYSISQKALAKLLDVTPFTVSHWEIGKNRPRPVQIEAFSQLAKLGKRKLYALVAEKAPEELPAPKKAAKKAAKTVAKKNPKEAVKKAAAPAKRGRKKAVKKAAAPAAPAGEKKA